MAGIAADVALMVDPRFKGGTASAFATDVKAFLGMGLRVALHFARARYFFRSGDGDNPDLLALRDLDGVSVCPPQGVRARAVLFHHPMVFLHGVDNPVPVSADRAAIIAHQAPFEGNRALLYSPMTVQSAVRRQFGIAPLWAPISGLCRRQLASFQPLIRLTAGDWANTFDTGQFAPKRDKLTGPDLTIGRHGRADPLKWPETGAALAASLPAGPRTHVRVMGADPGFFAGLGVDMTGWDILPFNAEPVAGFLDQLDVFSYFFAPTLVETFGRTVAEAMLMGVRCILDPRLEPSFGDMALYCRPDEVAGRLERLRADLQGARRAAEDARARCLARFSTEAVAGQWQSLLADPGTTRRETPAFAPIETARRLAGFHRRASARKVTQ